MTYIYRKRGYCWNCGRRTSHQDKKQQWFCKECEMKSIENTINDEDKSILKIIKNSKLSDNEIKTLLKGSKEIPNSGKPYSIKGEKFSFGVFGDTHIGHKCFDTALADYAINEFNKRKVDFVVHSGDICEGHYESKRQGSVFDLAHIGGDSQIEEAVKYLSKLKRPLYFITGNHETNTFYKQCGFDIGKQIEKKIPNSHYLGIQEGEINLPHHQKINVIHPDGGTAYAISYNPQKIIESLEGGKKPAILLIGHYHKAEYLFYRNVHMLQTATLESQTPFQKNLHISAHKGFWIVNAEISKDGISKFVPEFYPAY
jgi:predicted phosphodiesterase